ncbi:cationic amino acid transporter 8, vacuolar-like [Arachis hypogaea]|uniref:cationic amino acid transporter 8, vacuolar-like n=1 Tax=Arachis hypogaea TaxID=3818 RepID=UPI003B224A6E
MRHCLTAWDLTWLTFGSEIFAIIGQEPRTDASPTIILAYVISGFSALLSTLCYNEFAVDVPVAGGSFSFLRIDLGDFIAFLAAGNILLEAIVGAAGLGRSWSSYFASMIKNNLDFFRIWVNSFQKGYNMLDPIAVVIFLSPMVLQ